CWLTCESEFTKFTEGYRSAIGSIMFKVMICLNQLD
ncbi:unnamed protein product, partial [marine sediment metagenome]